MYNLNTSVFASDDDMQNGKREKNIDIIKLQQHFKVISRRYYAKMTEPKLYTTTDFRRKSDFFSENFAFFITKMEIKWA